MIECFSHTKFSVRFVAEEPFGGWRGMNLPLSNFSRSVVDHNMICYRRYRMINYDEICFDILHKCFIFLSNRLLFNRYFCVIVYNGQ